MLVSTQNVKDDVAVENLLQKMNMQSNYVIINQSEESKISNSCVFTKQEKGLSKSRNQAILYATAPILLFADDDVTYTPDYANTIIKYHNQYDDADIICFYVESKNEKRKTKRMKTRKSRISKSNENCVF